MGGGTQLTESPEKPGRFSLRSAAFWNSIEKEATKWLVPD